MPRTTHRTLALLFFSTMALALTVVMVVPGLGSAQEATPSQGEGSSSQLMSQGEGIYNKTCIACHQPGGKGAKSEESSFTHYPALAGNAFVTTDDPTALITTVLTGRAGMPTFRGMSDEELASVLTYIRGSWGNDASAVQPEQVTEIRNSLPSATIPPSTPIPSPALEATPVP